MFGWLRPLFPSEARANNNPPLKDDGAEPIVCTHGIILIAICPAKNRCYVKKFTYDVSFFTYDVIFFT